MSPACKKQNSVRCPSLEEVPQRAEACLNTLILLHDLVYDSVHLAYLLTSVQ